MRSNSAVACSLLPPTNKERRFTSFEFLSARSELTCDVQAGVASVTWMTEVVELLWRGALGRTGSDIGPAQSTGEL